MSYTIVDLGTLGGSSSRATAINTGGEVAGQSVTASGLRHAFLHSGGATRDLGTLGGAESSGQERLKAARNALELKKAQVPAALQMYVQFAIDGLNRALDPSRWTTVGLVLNAGSRDTLAELRMAAGWLYWADPAVQVATLDEQREIVRAMGEIVGSASTRSSTSSAKARRPTRGRCGPRSTC